MKEYVMTEQQQQRLRSFASLKWYEEAIKFLFNFAAKTSEVLLAAGLVVSTANFLTDGKVMGNSAGLATAWAWAQALAIDSSLGVTFSYIFTGIKHHDWIKVLCYGLLTLLLAVVAGTITNIDTFSHAIHITIANATIQMGLNVKLLTTLRAVAVVGFVLMSRLKDISFKELYDTATPTVPPTSQRPTTPEEFNRTVVLIRKLIAEALVQQKSMMVTEERGTLPSSMKQAREETPQQQAGATAPQLGEGSRANQEEQQDDPLEEREARLVRAYQELEAEGKRISGRALATLAHVRRTTCNQWLVKYHPEIADEESE
jgi:hypothetical protein